MLIANDLLSAKTLKVLPIEDLLDKPKQTRTKRPKRMDWGHSLSLSLSLCFSLPDKQHKLIMPQTVDLFDKSIG